MNMNRPDMTETVKSFDYTKKSLQSDSDPATMEVVTRTNAVKSVGDRAIYHLSESKCTVSAHFLHTVCTFAQIRGFSAQGLHSLLSFA